MSLTHLLKEKDFKCGSQKNPNYMLCKIYTHKTKEFRKAKNRDGWKYTWQVKTSKQTNKKSEEVILISDKVEFKP